jgi:hypothetical protein
MMTDVVIYTEKGTQNKSHQCRGREMITEKKAPFWLFRRLRLFWLLVSITFQNVFKVSWLVLQCPRCLKFRLILLALTSGKIFEHLACHKFCPRKFYRVRDLSNLRDILLQEAFVVCIIGRVRQKGRGRQMKLLLKL